MTISMNICDIYINTAAIYHQYHYSLLNVVILIVFS